MKMFKNIIKLLVLTSLSLSLIPLTTAKAATAIQVTDATKAATSSKLAVTYSALSSSATPVTEASSTDTTTTTEAGQPAKSDVSVTVLSGILTLEAVPDFNFGTVTLGSTGKLKSNTVDTDGFVLDNGTNADRATAGRDGNDTGLLEVVDSRNSLTTMPGFTLSAALGKLNPTMINSDDPSLDAILHLNQMPLLDDENNNVSSTGTDLKTDKASISSALGNDVPIMNMTPGSYNGGVIKANFNTPDSASLEIPGSGDNTKATSKRMNAIVTWTLNAAPAVTTN
ncbi:WxL domain-containing protein [Companilactobacillus huachuanensis]|uniref:WxL domain-containing protein n=1 Tax=Companilactobacillus huachuanensis TaxID=2559914 RepID=A0ABW1RMN3_9LACO|nr:WxL domain-containing protein [Companilactobacillus huachuanensis]